MKIVSIKCFISLLFPIIVFAQNGNRDFSVSGSINYITTSKLHLNPRSSDPVLRNSYLPLDGILSYSFEFRMNIFKDALMIGVGSEYLSKTDNLKSIRAMVNNIPRTIEITDGYSMIPIEVTIYYVFPFSGSWFKMAMGGGIGAYFGKHIREIGDITVSTLEKRIIFGMHVALDAEFFITDYFSIRTEMKFRDPDFETKSKYNKTDTILNGEHIQLLSEDFYSRINIDGINFILGLAFHF